MPEAELPADVEERREALAKRTGRSKGFHAREAIVARLDELEETRLAERRLEDLRTGRAGKTPLSAVMADHDMEG